MYARFAERRGWHTRLVSESRSDVGGYKEVIFEVVGKDAYGTLRLERGVHRIQRIPETEKTGRIHTSTATVAVLPKATDVEVEIRPEDLRIDTYRAGGHGGQKVQKTDSAVRITHLPTGLVVQCQDERSQQKNKERAMEVLRARLLALRIEEQARAQGAARRAQIGTGDRSEKIRTYNVPQNRVTDHRIKRSWHDVGRVLDGDLDGLVNDLQGALEEQQLKGSPKT
jgi:peptide chain release factor 1